MLSIQMVVISPLVMKFASTQTMQLTVIVCLQYNIFSVCLNLRSIDSYCVIFADLTSTFTQIAQLNQTHVCNL